MFTRDDLKTLMSVRADPAVSIFLPTHTAGREIRQDPIRLRNLLAQAEERLTAAGRRRPEVAELLAPAHRLVDEPQFWRHQQAGLAVLLAPGVFRTYRVPMGFEERLQIADRFHISPLLPLLADDGRFLVLSLTLKRVRLFEASRFTMTEMERDDLPDGFDSFLARTDYEDVLGFHPTGPTPTTGGVPWAKLHALGESSEDLLEQELTEYLRWLAAAVAEVLADTRAPLVLAADERLQGRFRQHNGYRELVEEGITEDPEALDEAELHRRAYALVQPRFARTRHEAIDRYRALAGDPATCERAPSDLGEIVSAAWQGRVEFLFLAAGGQVWGSFDETTGQASVHDRQFPGDTNLLDLAAIHTLATGGTVQALPAEEMPAAGHPAAAILRY